MDVAICLVCYDAFEQTKPWVRFCSTKCRRKAWKSDDLKLVMIERLCVYCGDIASTVDHVPPTTIRERMSATDREDFEFVVVPACRECNCAILSGKPLYTVEDRTAFVKEALQRRHKRLLAMPDWSDDDLSEMSGSFASGLAGYQSYRDSVKARIAWKLE